MAVPARHLGRQIQPVNKHVAPSAAGLPLLALMVVAALAGCNRETGLGVDAGPPALLSANAAQAAVVGTAFSYDATKGGTAFSDPRGLATPQTRKSATTFTTPASTP